ncbi:hypothetical protein QBC38DRAFT_452654 [Podospora fimiseda]|uniref:Uncharacterized protein n=1 Tax=Podospora fimiseda TaxID=252190 RepID=A0AAN7BV66_9PEZI|nr:hypothetical protein QBC38DRAFT_452654 [Podospora fimiseda]
MSRKSVPSAPEITTSPPDLTHDKDGNRIRRKMPERTATIVNNKETRVGTMADLNGNRAEDAAMGIEDDSNDSSTGNGSTRHIPSSLNVLNLSTTSSLPVNQTPSSLTHHQIFNNHHHMQLEQMEAGILISGAMYDAHIAAIEEERRQAEARRVVRAESLLFPQETNQAASCSAVMTNHVQPGDSGIELNERATGNNNNNNNTNPGNDNNNVNGTSGGQNGSHQGKCKKICCCTIL